MSRVQQRQGSNVFPFSVYYYSLGSSFFKSLNIFSPAILDTNALVGPVEDSGGQTSLECAVLREECISCLCFHAQLFMMPLEESEAFNIAFMQAVEIYNCFYDTTSTDYTSKDEHGTTWHTSLTFVFALQLQNQCKPLHFPSNTGDHTTDQNNYISLILP